MNPLRIDPSRTGKIVKDLLVDWQKRLLSLMREVSYQVGHLDTFSLGMKPGLKLNAFEFSTDDQKVAQFQEWFQQQIDDKLLDTKSKTPWSEKYVQSAYTKGVVRAYTDAHASDLKASMDFYKGSEAQFLKSSFGRQERVTKMKLLSLRTYEQLKGITPEISKKIAILLTSGMAHGKNPRTIAAEMSKTISTIGKARAKTIARTEIIHAHAEGQLDAFEDMNIDQVGVLAELSTANDGHVCETCLALAGKVYTLKEARGILPLHPNCRCCWVPYVPSSEEQQQSAKSKMEKERAKNKKLGAITTKTAITKAARKAAEGRKTKVEVPPVVIEGEPFRGTEPLPRQPQTATQRTQQPEPTPKVPAPAPEPTKKPRVKPEKEKGLLKFPGVPFKDTEKIPQPTKAQKKEAKEELKTIKLKKKLEGTKGKKQTQPKVTKFKPDPLPKKPQVKKVEEVLFQPTKAQEKEAKKLEAEKVKAEKEAAKVKKDDGIKRVADNPNIKTPKQFREAFMEEARKQVTELPHAAELSKLTMEKDTIYWEMERLRAEQASWEGKAKARERGASEKVSELKMEAYRVQKVWSAKEQEIAKKKVEFDEAKRTIGLNLLSERNSASDLLTKDVRKNLGHASDVSERLLKLIPSDKLTEKEKMNIMAAKLSKEGPARGTYGQYIGGPVKELRLRKPKKDDSPLTKAHMSVTTAHEYGHHLAENIEGFMAKQDKFFKDRTKGEQLARLDGYAEHIKGKKDHFDSYGIYAGRVYEDGRSPELASVGIEMLFKDPIAAAENDPEWFDMIMGGLKKI